MAAAAFSSETPSTQLRPDELVETLIGPDPEKLAELDSMRKMKGGADKWPVLRRRFEKGNSCEGQVAIDVLKLILEVQDFLLTPIHAHRSVSTTLTRTGRQKPVIVMVGITGAGKSVTGNWLLGKTVRKYLPIPAADADSDDEQPSPIIVVDGGELAVGDDLYKSKTFAPNVINHADFTLVDFPGFCDTNGFEVRLGMDLAFRDMLNLMKPAHVLCLMQIESFSVGRGEGARLQLDKMRRLLPMTGCPLSGQTNATAESSCTWLLGITKCDKDLVKGAKDKFAAATTFIEGWDVHFPADHILNINKLMFSSKGENTRDALLRRLMTETRTPEQPMNCLKGQLQRAFGKNHVPSSLASDCLSVADTQKLAQVMRETSFESILYEGSRKNPLTSTAQWAKLEAGKSAEKRWGKQWDEKRLKESWEAAASDIAKEISALTNQTKVICGLSDELKKTGHLGLEMMSEPVRQLCSTAQPGLKLAFLTAEKQIMTRNMTDMILLFNNLVDLTEALHKHDCILRSDHESVKAKSDAVKMQLDKGARTLGFQDADDLYCIKSAVAGTTMMAIGGVGMYMGAGAAVATAEAGAGAAATGVAVGVAATPYIVIGGGLLLVAGAITGITAFIRTRLAASWSGQFKQSLTMAFSELEKTSQAVLDHRLNLEAVQEHLKNLELLS